jgi:hypothetical protein
MGGSRARVVGRRPAPRKDGASLPLSTHPWHHMDYSEVWRLPSVFLLPIPRLIPLWPERHIWPDFTIFKLKFFAVVVIIKNMVSLVNVPHSQK